jgi:CBS domain-containing protein
MSASSTKGGFLERRLAGEQQVLARSLRSLIRQPPITCTGAHTVRAAVSLMHDRGVGSVVVVDGAGCPEGIFTTQDLVEAAALQL